LPELETRRVQKARLLPRVIVSWSRPLPSPIRSSLAPPSGTLTAVGADSRAPTRAVTR
jgi:hypothetical protein